MDQNALVEHVFAATQAIEHAVLMADWPQAARLMEERAPLIQSLSPNQEPAALELIRRIQSMDAAVMKEAQAAQVELHEEYREAMQRIRAAKQYHRVALF